MIADFDKYNACLDHTDQVSLRRFFASRKIWLPANLVYFLTLKLFPSKADLQRALRADNVDDERDLTTAAWYHPGSCHREARWTAARLSSAVASRRSWPGSFPAAVRIPSTVVRCDSFPESRTLAR